MEQRKIYVASSWRNYLQPAIVSMLRNLGHEVYDFRNPPNKTGFKWSEIDPNWQSWTPEEYRKALEHPLAVEGHRSDLDAMIWADTCVLVLPSGRSASYEFGWCVGQGKEGVVVQIDDCEPELMYRGNRILVSTDEIFDYFEIPSEIEQIETMKQKRTEEHGV